MDPLVTVVLTTVLATAAREATPVLIKASIAMLEALREYVRALDLPEGKLKRHLAVIDGKMEVLKALLPEDTVQKVKKVRKTAKNSKKSAKKAPAKGKKPSRAKKPTAKPSKPLLRAFDTLLRRDK